jgi:aryl-alcohol dehydrogenase-like predicted oxidoreductase
VGPGTIRRAHAVHPLSAVQTEYSFWERSVEEKVLPTLRNLGIGLVAYSPIGRGYLSGKVERYEDFDQTDFRRNHPRFQAENLDRNRRIVEAIEHFANANRVTPAQLAIAWVLRRGAADLKLPESVWQQLEAAASSFNTFGPRYAAPQMQAIDTSD